MDIAAAIREAYINAENQQGPLDGRWRLSTTQGVAIFAFVFADTGGAPSPRASTPSNPDIEGAWRDLGREGAADASGLLADVRHVADGVEIHFYSPGASGAVMVTLHRGEGGVWSGVLVQAGGSTPVTMTRF